MREIKFHEIETIILSRMRDINKDLKKSCDEDEAIGYMVLKNNLNEIVNYIDEILEICNHEKK